MYDKIYQMDFDIEDIGSSTNQQVIQDEIYIDEEYNKGEVIRNDFNVALDLFGDDYINKNPEKRVNCLDFIPKTVDDFIVYKKSIIDIIEGIDSSDKVSCIKSLLNNLTITYKARNLYDLQERINKID